MKAAWRKIRARVLRHEVWVANTAIEFPFFSMFLIMSLFAVWLFLPAIIPSILAVKIYTSVDWPQTGVFPQFISIFWLIIAIPLNVILFLWFGRWYLIGVSLMLGSEQSACKKLAETKAKLKALTDA